MQSRDLQHGQVLDSVKRQLEQKLERRSARIQQLTAEKAALEQRLQNEAQRCADLKQEVAKLAKGAER